MLYSLDEICLIPNTVSDIEHRGDVNVLTNKNKYPIFTAPMSCITDETNYKTFCDHRLNVIIPRSVEWTKRLQFLKDGAWVAVGFKEAQYIYEHLELEVLTVENTIRICIDQANGHMESLLKLCKDLKERFGNKLKLMTGNIANPYTYREYAKAGVDYVRCSIGSGNVCTTSVQTGMHYPLGSLIIKCNEERNYVKTAITLGAKYLSVPKIVADGGFKRIDQCIKALALGADFVMLGEILAKSIEACGDIYEMRYDDPAVPHYYPVKLPVDSNINNIYREYFGMSTEKAQQIVNDASLFKVDIFVPKHTEGQSKMLPIQYHLFEWLADFEHALRSSMSYAGANTLNEYQGHVKYDFMTPVTYNAYMK